METKLCRICGKLGQDFLHIFKTEGLRSKIETCLPIIVSPVSLLPDTICRECTESIESFYIFTKNCLQNIIVLEIQYNIQDSCLKSRQKKDRGCLANICPPQKSISVQTVDYLDMLSGKNDFVEYSSNFPLTLKFSETADNIPKTTIPLVDYEIETDSGSEENSNDGKVVLSEKLHSIKQIDNFMEAMISNINPFSKTRYFDDRENNLISEITQRKNLKRKNDFIGNSRTKIFKMDTSNRRKNKIPKKLDELRIGNKRKTSNIETPDEFELSTNTMLQKNDVTSDKSNYEVEPQDQTIPAQVEKLLSSLPQSCLLCDRNFAGAAALATHVFETHGIDMAEVVSSGSRESFPEKNKKKLPNLVKISDLKRNDSTEEMASMEDQQVEEQPPMLLPSFVCSNCPAVFTSKSDLMLHLRMKHPQQNAHLCGVCLQQCTSYMNLKNHLQTCTQLHQLTTRYFCQICQYGDNNFKLLENHVLVHEFLLEDCKKQQRMFDPADYINTNDNFENGTLSPTSKGLNCSECGLNDFESFKTFSTHRRSKHSIFHCDLCNKFYGRNSHLWKHVNRLHKGHPSITCQLCYKTSASKYHLAQHFNKIHLTKGPKLKSLDAQLTEKELKEDFMSQKFQAFDFQSVKQSFMKQELIELEKKKNLKDIEDNSNHTTEPEDELTSNKTIKEDITFKDDMLIKEEADELDLSQNPYTNVLTNYTPYSNNHSDDDNSEEDGTVVEKNIKEEAPKEIDSSHNLYTNIITNYTPPLNEGEFKCLKCSKAFHKMVLLKKHKKNCRPKMQKDLLTRCKSCARIFKDRQSLAKHLVNYHSEYICEICNQKVQSKCEIVSHIRFQHPGCHLFCHTCKNILRSQDDLQEHLSNHSESYICQFCADPLPSKIKLKMHILSLHRKILSLSCGICLKLFETQHVLRNHVTLVHKDQLTPLTSCPVCGKNYGSKWKTYDHLNKSHGRIFKACKTCLEVFDNDAQLQAHRDVTAHGGTGSNVAATCLRNSLMAHISTVIKDAVGGEVNANEEAGSGSGEENGDSDHTDDEYDNEQVEEEAVQKKLFQSQSSKISLLERRLLGKKLPEPETNIKEKHKSVKKKNPLESKKEKQAIKKEDDLEQINSPSNPLINSSKRTVYVNSNDPSYCEICFKTWPAKKHLWQHYIRCHKTVAATVCGICLKTNDNYETLQKHLCENHPTLLHGQGFGSNFICRICGRYHNASSKLRLHMVIHENFDWKLIENIPNNNETKEKDQKSVNGFKEYKEEEPENETYDDNDINYDSLIEQVECSSQSENEESDENLRVVTKNEQQGSSSDDDADTEDSAMSENSLQAQMLQNMMTEKQAATKNSEYASSSDESNSSFTGEGESSEDEASGESLSSRGKFHANSDTTDSMLNSNIFRRKPEELDSAIKSISYECMEQVDLNVVDDFCELQGNCLNENEIESAVGSIL